MSLNRQDLSRIYGYGVGLEIGAYHNPFPYRGTMFNLDKWDTQTMLTMAENDPNVRSKPIASVNFVDDGQWLKTIPDNDYEFLVSSHQIEHVESPLTALENHLRVIKKNGYVIYVIPDKRYTFDKDREITPFEHILEDYQNESNKTFHYDRNLVHFDDYLFHVDKINCLADRSRITAERLKANQDIHFHVWDADAMLELFDKARSHIKQKYSIDLFARAGHENFVVLKKL